jgi:hypothetical protein
MVPENEVQLPADVEPAAPAEPNTKEVAEAALDLAKTTLEAAQKVQKAYEDAVVRGDEAEQDEAGEGDFAEDAYDEIFDEQAPVTYADFGLMTEEELAFAFDLTKNTLAKWRKNEDPNEQSGPAFIRIGKCIYYANIDVEAWLYHNREIPPAYKVKKDEHGDPNAMPAAAPVEPAQAGPAQAEMPLEMAKAA